MIHFQFLLLTQGANTDYEWSDVDCAFLTCQERTVAPDIPTVSAAG
jgi:hypothetical protein